MKIYVPFRSTWRLIAIAISVGSLITGAEGAILFDASGTSIAPHQTGYYSRGNEFSIASPLDIVGLAYIDAEGDGLTISHEVTLWDTSTLSLIASATVTPSSSFSVSANGVSRWYETTIPTLTLTPGTYRVVGIYGTNDAGLDSPATTGISGVSLTSGYVRNGFPNGGLRYPDGSYPNQQVTANVVIPEPASIGLLAVVSSGIYFTRRFFIA